MTSGGGSAGRAGDQEQQRPVVIEAGVTSTMVTVGLIVGAVKHTYRCRVEAIEATREIASPDDQILATELAEVWRNDRRRRGGS